MATIRIAKEDMDAFAEASGDLNPLHLEGGSAAGNAFETPVAYGVLTVLHAIHELSADSGRGLQVLDATFGRALLLGAEYEIGVQRDGPGRATAWVRDGDLPAARVEARFAGSDMPFSPVGIAERLVRPARHSLEQLESGQVVQGTYGSSESSLRWIRERFCLQPFAVGDYALHSLLCASYLVGMVMPGLGAMMSTLRIVLSPATPDGGVTVGDDRPLSYRASVVDLDPRVGMVTVASDIRHANRTVASLTCEVHLPQAPQRIDLDLLRRELGGTSRALEGRTAVVVGASRGFGAALVHGLASQGCSVYACSRSGREREPPVAPSWRGLIRQVQGDGSDSSHCRQLLERIEKGHGGLDFLLCCGAPRLRGIGFGPLSAGRFNTFVRQSIELVSVPMATMLRAIEVKEGACLFVSSEAVKTMPGEWGHYVASKGAGEALAAWAARQFPNVEMLVARVPQLENRPPIDGVDSAVRKEVAAAWLVRRLIARSGSGAHLLEWPT